MLRILHFSDIHLRAPYSALPVSDIGPKRLLGAANLALRREAHFREASRKVAALLPFIEAQDVEAVICTGDYTALGTQEELRIAHDAIEKLTHRRHGFITVPGNHDVYVNSAVRERRFETHFAAFLHSDLPEYVADKPWPVVRLINDDVAVIALNSARPNPQLWRSSGIVPQAQLDALARVLADERIASRRVFLITHYAMRRRDGKYDHPWHGLTNADALVAVASQHSRLAILHGHIHWTYSHTLHGLSGRVFGAGSATFAGREGVWLYELDEGRATAIPGRWNGDCFVLDHGKSVAIFGA